VVNVLVMLAFGVYLLSPGHKLPFDPKQLPVNAEKHQHESSSQQHEEDTDVGTLVAEQWPRHYQ
jgi:hypothetical protein